MVIMGTDGNIRETIENIHKDIEDIKERLERLEKLENRRASIGLKPFDENMENELNGIRTKFEGGEHNDYKSLKELLFENTENHNQN